MKGKKCVEEMSERELKRYGRALRLRRERRRRIFTFSAAVFTAFFLLLACAASYGSIRSSASSGFKYYTSVTVEAGETLWGLADRYIDYEYYSDRNSYMDEVRSINHLDGDDSALTAGQILILPYYSSDFFY